MKFDKIKTFLRKHRIALLIVAGYLMLVAVMTAFLAVNKNRAVAPTSDEVSAPTPAAEITTPTPVAAKSAIKSAPPKHTTSGNIAGSTTSNSDGSKTVTTSEGAITQSDYDQARAAGASGSSPSTVHYIDETGQNPNLGADLKNYIANSLLWKGEISSLYAIILENAGASGWTGLYSGSYNIDQSGRITSAWAYITLNTYYYSSSPYFEDYMKLTLSHEYGHHYTLYHKWLDWQLPAGNRFPDEYYATRPLTKATTTFDYSLGWGNCDAEIIAEDYSYIFSGYGYDAMAATYGYPSAAMRSWLDSFSSGPPASPPPVTPPATDSENPTVVINLPATNPYDWSSGNLQIQATGSDNVGVVKIELYIKALSPIPSQNDGLICQFGSD
ncbi:MAG: hypothetical protein NTW79_01870 [Candidatus Berkelbacteria bacterium]|nr:hypothetical protein [Candidatus Berkelbacteria bacterium]